jgi:predicted permease
MFRKLRNRLESRLRRRNLDGEMDDELRFHLEMQIEKNVAAGMSPEEARRVALRDFGGALQMKEACRDTRHTWLDSVWQDVRYAVRSFRRDHVFTITAILTLAVGIGATTSTFSIVDGVLFRPLPYPDPDRVVMFMAGSPGDVAEGLKQDDFAALHRARSLEAVASYSAFVTGSVTMTGVGPAERVCTADATSEFFAVLGVHPFIGRDFTAHDGDDVAILTYGLWKRRFGGDRSVVGRTISFLERQVTIVGVMPPEFWYPRTTAKEAPEMLLGDRVEWDKPLPPNAVRFLIGRLRKGVSLREAQAEADVIAARLGPRTAGQAAPGIFVTPLRSEMVIFQRNPLLIVLGAVLFLLLIACVNVANLMVARGRAREREFAIRSTLGAGRLRIARQLLTESVLLALIGGAIGVLVSYWTLDVLLAQVPESLRPVRDIGIDHRALAFSGLLTLATAVVFGAVPALEASRPDLATGMKVRIPTQHRLRFHGGTTRRLLLVVEVGLTLVLLVGAGLLTNSFVRLTKVDVGFDTSNVVVARVVTPKTRYPSDQQVALFFKQAVERLRALPGVQSASTADLSPLSSAMMGASARIEGHPGEEHPDTLRVGTTYFETLGIPVVAGRMFGPSDEGQRASVAVVNETMAQRYWPGGDAIGRAVTVWRDTPVRIVGVVRDTRTGLRDSQTGMRRAAQPTIFVPYDPAYRAFRGRTFIVETTPGRGGLPTAIRTEIAGMDRDMALEPETLEESIGLAVATPRFYAFIVALFASIGLLLSAVGVAGIAAHDVVRRRHEIGVRMALGASGTRVVRSMTTRVAIPVAVGLALGIVAASALTRVLASLLFEIKPRDPVTFAAVAALLAAVALVATYLPARRAARVDPIEVLRAE